MVPKKLLQINTTANWGSTGQIAEEIGKVVTDRGWKSYIAYGRYHAESNSELIPIGSKKDVLYHVWLTRMADRHGLGSSEATRRFIRQIEEIRPDIIQLHNIHGYFLNLKVLFNYLCSLSIPVVWVFHDCWPITGHCSHFDHVNCEKWKSLCHHCPQKKQYPKSYLIDRSRKNYELKKQWFSKVPNMTIVTISNWSKSILEQSFLKHYPIRIIPNGVDTEIFKPYFEREEVKEKYGVKGKFLILGVASTWSERKGLEDFKRLSRKIGDNAVILLVGLSKQQCKNTGNRIFGIERTENRTELAHLYSAADVYVSFSVEETFGMTILEALSCGTPTVIYRVTACPELVTPETGAVVETGDVDGAWQAIREIGTKSKTVYTTACRTHVLQHYKKEACYYKYYQLYNELLSGKETGE